MYILSYRDGEGHGSQFPITEVATEHEGHRADQILTRLNQDLVKDEISFLSFQIPNILKGAYVGLLLL